MKNIKMRLLPNFLRKYFWDIDFNELNLEKYQEYIILRILEYGDIKSVSWLFKNISRKEIKDTLSSHRGLSLKSLYFWSLFLSINKEEILCLKKPYQKMQKIHWPY